MLVILHYLLICNGFCSAKKQLKKSFRNKFCAPHGTVFTLCNQKVSQYF